MTPQERILVRRRRSELVTDIQFVRGQIKRLQGAAKKNLQSRLRSLQERADALQELLDQGGNA